MIYRYKAWNDIVIRNDCRSVGAGSKPTRYRQIYILLQSGGFRTHPYGDTLNIPVNHYLYVIKCTG